MNQYEGAPSEFCQTSHNFLVDFEDVHGREREVVFKTDVERRFT